MTYHKAMTGSVPLVPLMLSCLAVIIARENEVLDQSALAIFDNHQRNFTNNEYIRVLNIYRYLNYQL